MGKQKKPDPAFELVFTGGGIYPERIPLGKVVEALSAVKRLAAGEVATEEEEEEEDKSDGEIRLVDITRTSSAVFRFIGLSSPKQTIQRLKQMGRILNNPDDVGDNEYILRPVKDLSAIADSLNCSVLLREVGKHRDPLAEIEADSYSRLAKSILISGDTKLSGIVKRVGGATEMRCALRVTFQSHLLYCRVGSEEVARKLGEALYQRVIASGPARWLKNSMRLYSFTVNDVTTSKSGTISDHLDALWEAGLNDWANIDDPDRVLQEIRGDD